VAFIGGQLKPKKDEVVKEFVCGGDVFVSLPKGSGKSLCYAVLPAVSFACYSSAGL